MQKSFAENQKHQRAAKPVCTVYTRGLQTFLSKGHISYYRTNRGPDVLRNVIVSG